MKQVSSFEYYTRTRVGYVDIRRMCTKRTYDEFVTKGGVPLGEKHQVLKRGKVVQETFFLTEAAWPQSKA